MPDSAARSPHRGLQHTSVCVTASAYATSPGRWASGLCDAPDWLFLELWTQLNAWDTGDKWCLDSFRNVHISQMERVPEK